MSLSGLGNGNGNSKVGPQLERIVVDATVPFGRLGTQVSVGAAGVWRSCPSAAMRSQQRAASSEHRAVTFLSSQVERCRTCFRVSSQWGPWYAHTCAQRVAEALSLLVGADRESARRSSFVPS